MHFVSLSKLKEQMFETNEFLPGKRLMNFNNRIILITNTDDGYKFN